jgi:hypothetical protein
MEQYRQHPSGGVLEISPVVSAETAKRVHVVKDVRTKK